MKTISNSIKALGLLGALGVAALMTGCMGQGGLGADAEVGAGVVLAGTVAGQQTGSEVTVVTTHEVSAEGVVGPAVDSAQVAADGSFEIRTKLRGEKALLVRAFRAGKEFRCRFENRLESGSKHTLGMIDAFTTLDAETWIELRKSPEGRAILAADIRAAVNAYLDSLGVGGIELDSASREAIVTQIVLMAKARAHVRVALIAALIAHADSARPPYGKDSTDTTRIHPRPELTPCERAAFLIAAMDPTHPDFLELRARFAASCMEQDTIPPTPTACADIRARLDGLEPGTPIALGLRLRLAAYCTNDAPPPQPLTRCERAAVRLTLMDPDRGSYTALKAVFRKQCLDADPENDGAVDSVNVSALVETILRADA
jgi:hypothetical protein